MRIVGLNQFECPEGVRLDMNKAFVGIMVMLMLVLSACATSASRTFKVEVDQHSIQYTPGQIRDFLRDRGFRRVRFKDKTNDRMVYEKRTAGSSEQHFRLETAQQMEVIVRLDSTKYTFGDSKPRVIVKFIEDGATSLSATAREEYEHLLARVVERVGADRVKE